MPPHGECFRRGNSRGRSTVIGPTACGANRGKHRKGKKYDSRSQEKSAQKIATTKLHKFSDKRSAVLCFFGKWRQMPSEPLARGAGNVCFFQTAGAEYPARLNLRFSVHSALKHEKAVGPASEQARTGSRLSRWQTGILRYIRPGKSVYFLLWFSFFFNHLAAR